MFSFDGKIFNIFEYACFRNVKKNISTFQLKNVSYLGLCVASQDEDILLFGNRQ